MAAEENYDDSVKNEGEEEFEVIEDEKEEIKDDEQDEIKDTDADTEDIIKEDKAYDTEIIERIGNIEKTLDSIMQKFSAFATDARIVDSSPVDVSEDLVVDSPTDYRDFDLSV